MREIKFRAWDTFAKEMKLPTLLRLSRSLPFTDDNNNGKVNQIQCNGENHIEYFGDSYILMQYTGLNDVHNKELYEDDVVDWQGIKYKICIGEFGLRDIESEGVTDIAYGVYGSAIGETLEPFCFDMQINSAWIKQDGIEVIGNIHSNPELLEVRA